MTSLEKKELAVLIILCLVALLILIAVVALIIHVITGLTKRKLATLVQVKDFLKSKPVHVATITFIITEFYNAYTYHTGINWLAILQMLGITGVAASLNQAKKTQKEIQQDTEVIVSQGVDTGPSRSEKVPVTPTSPKGNII